MAGGRPKGTPKTGGRKPGSLNKRTRALKERLLRDEALSIENTVESIRRGAYYDLREFFDEAGNLKPLHELSERQAWAIQGFDVVRRNLEGGDGHSDTIVKIKLADRKGYVELAAKHQGMLTEKVEISGDDVLISALRRGRERVAQGKKP